MKFTFNKKYEMFYIKKQRSCKNKDLFAKHDYQLKTKNANETQPLQIKTQNTLENFTKLFSH